MQTRSSALSSSRRARIRASTEPAGKSDDRAGALSVEGSIDEASARFAEVSVALGAVSRFSVKLLFDHYEGTPYHI
jgi:hypothetical protein